MSSKMRGNVSTSFMAQVLQLPYRILAPLDIVLNHSTIRYLKKFDLQTYTFALVFACLGIVSSL